MKKFFYFLIWMYRKMDWFDRSMLVAGFLMGASVPLDAPLREYVFWAGLSVPIFWALRFIFYVGPRTAWRRYNEEQEETVGLLKKDYSNERKF